MTKSGRIGIGVTIVSVFLLAGFAAWLIFLKDNAPVMPPAVKSDAVSKATFVDEAYGLKFAFPSYLQPSTLNETDDTARILLRLEQPKAPEFMITVKGEKGLRGPAQIAKLEVLQLVTNGALSSLPGRYPGYKLISDKSVTINTLKAHEILFTYEGPSGVRAKQRLILLSGNSDTALYISMQSRDTDFDGLNSSVFEPIAQSITNI